MNNNFKLFTMRKNIFTKLIMAFTLTLVIGLTGCNREDVDYETPVLKVDKTQLNFDADGKTSNNENSFTIETNREWSIAIPEADKEWIRLSKESGNGKTSVEVTVLPNQNEDRTVRLKISSSINYEYIDIKQAGKTIIIYSENVGNTNAQKDADGKWPLVSVFTGWLKGGSSGSDVTYDGTDVSVRTSTPSSEYTGASGGNNIFFGALGHKFIIKNIDITGKTNFTFKFGISRQVFGSGFKAIDENTIKLSASIDGTNYTSLTFTNDSKANWVIATSEFKAPSGSTKLFLKFDQGIAASEIRIDDFTLTDGGNGTIEIGSGGVTPPQPTQAILYENMGGTEVTANTQVDAFTAWLKSGSGASGVTYTGSAKTDVRKSMKSDDKYDGASGGNNIFFGADANGTFEIKDIDITGKTQLTFKFGISYQADAYPAMDEITNTTIKLSASIDGTNYTPLTFTNANTKDWVLATSEFKVPSGSTKLYIKFADPAKISKVRLDDFTLTEGGNGTIEIGSGGATPSLILGTPTFTGSLTVGTAISTAKISIPYSNATGTENYNVSATVSGAGAAGISVTSKQVTLTPGSGNIELDVTGTPTTQGDVTFTLSGITGLAVTTINATVNTAGGGTSSNIFFEKVGNTVEKSNNKWPYTDQFTGWLREGSLAQSAVVYNGQGANVSNSGAAYAPASGSSISDAPYVGMSYSATSQRVFNIEKINITGKTNFTFKFASIFQAAYSGSPQFGPVTSTTFKLSGSLDGTNWTELSYSVQADPAGGNWYIGTSEFKAPTGSTTLYIKFEPTLAASQGVRLDDFTLTEGGSGTITVN